MTMLPELTPAVTRALEAARLHAAGAGSGQVAPLHLLTGLLEEEEGRAAALAVAAGLDLGAFRDALGGRRDAAPAGPEPRPLHPQVVEALDQAHSLALELNGETTVSGEVLLLALVRVDEAVLRRLESSGLRRERLEAERQRRRPPALQLDEPVELADVTERVDTARILDAAANRAREGLRVVEDCCRFALADAFLTGELKELRHGLTEALAELAPELLLAARETLRDVGTGLSTPDELERPSLRVVLQVNLKRAQEALRTLEEVAKVHSARAGQALEPLRYRCYTLERAVVLGASARERLRQARLCVLLSGASCAAALDWTIAEAAAGGAHVVQLREKGLSDRELLERARRVRRWTSKAGLLFVVNDRPDIARLAEADGVHLGQDDLPVQEARRVVGPDALVGVSTHDLGQLRRAVLDGASYVGVGPTFPSGTKEFAEFPGPEFVRAAAAETSLPAFAIGGINLDTVGAAVAAGARRVAVGQAVAQADDPRLAAAELLRVLAEG
jgi:thiamine-phosphate pyrophosphorylase